jgi:hypothetical protein
VEAIKQILIDEIATLNREERRDNRPRFSLSFLKNTFFAVERGDLVDQDLFNGFHFFTSLSSVSD